jgi:uncharacterized sulfatase
LISASAFAQAPASVAHAATPAPPKGQPAGAPRTNVIFVLIDDLGFGEFGCWGNPNVTTPNVDRLASEGIRFDRFYVNSPICSPSRTAFTTGQYPSRWRMTSYIDNRGKNEDRGMAQWLDLKAPVLARMLQSSGYRTGHFGKWHMGGGRDVGEAPLITEYGFDESLTQFEGLGDRVAPTFETLYPNQPHRAMPLAVASAKLGRGNVEYVPRYKVTGRYVQQTLAFINEAKQANEPFYVNVWPDDVHTPLEASPSSRGDGSQMDMYRGVLTELDRDLGTLFDAIRNDPKLRDNTMIVLASDNGNDPNIQISSGLRGHKGNLYEGGIRDPLIVWWPGGQEKSKAGSMDKNTVVAGFDLPATVLDATGVALPADAEFDGQSMAAAFRGRETKRDGVICWIRPPDRPGPKDENPDLAIRSDRWKLLCEEDGSQPQLYDVVADPREQSDLAKDNPKVVSELTAQVLAWQKQMPRVPLSRTESKPKAKSKS